jgi:hypothetical protein
MSPICLLEQVWREDHGPGRTQVATAGAKTVPETSYCVHILHPPSRFNQGRLNHVSLSRRSFPPWPHIACTAAGAFYTAGLNTGIREKPRSQHWRLHKSYALIYDVHSQSQRSLEVFEYHIL